MYIYIYVGGSFHVTMTTILMVLKTGFISLMQNIIYSFDFRVKHAGVFCEIHTPLQVNIGDP